MSEKRAHLPTDGTDGCTLSRFSFTSSRGRPFDACPDSVDANTSIAAAELSSAAIGPPNDAS